MYVDYSFVSEQTLGHREIWDCLVTSISNKENQPNDSTERDSSLSAYLEDKLEIHSRVETEELNTCESGRGMIGRRKTDPSEEDFDFPEESKWEEGCAGTDNFDEEEKEDWFVPKDVAVVDLNSAQTMVAQFLSTNLNEMHQHAQVRIHYQDQVKTDYTCIMH